MLQHSVVTPKSHHPGHVRALEVGSGAGLEVDRKKKPHPSVTGMSGLHTAVLMHGTRPPSPDCAPEDPGISASKSMVDTLWRWPQAGTFWEAVELPSIPAENMAVSLEQKAWWMNILDWQVMETKEKVRRHSRQAPFRHGPVADAHTHAHTMFCKIFKGILETLNGGACRAAEPH